MEPTREARSYTCGVLSGVRRLLLALAAICVFAVATTFGQESTYSDTWSADTPDDENVVYLDEVQGFVNGCGVTEDDYNSYNIYKVHTTIRSPSGRVNWAESYGDVGATRADVALPVDLENPEEGEYVVDTQHYYSYYDDPTLVAPSAEGPSPRTAYALSNTTRASGLVSGYRVMYQYQGRSGDRWVYVRACDSINCAGRSLYKYVSTSKWPYRYLNCTGIRFQVNLGFFRVIACLGGCVGSDVPLGCR